MIIRNVLGTALFTALIIVGSFIVIPVGIVPITLQTLFVLLAGVLSGKKIALSATSLYIVLGVVGLPVFSGATGGACSFLWSHRWLYYWTFDNGCHKRDL